MRPKPPSFFNQTSHSMKNSIYTLIFLLISSNLLLSQGTEKTLISSLSTQGQSAVDLDLPGDVEVAKWENTVIQVQATVRLANASEAVLKSLLTAGRYKIQAEVTDTGLRVTAPALGKKVTLGGVPLEESISYEIILPHNVSLHSIDGLGQAVDAKVER